MISLNNGSTIQPVYSTSTVRSNRSKLTQIFYRCPICKVSSFRPISELYLIKGEWYCRECVDKLNNSNI